MFFLKVWLHAATLFIYFYIKRAYIQYFIYDTRPLLISSLLPLGRGPPVGCRARFELGPGVQQADALLSEPRRTPLSHAAPQLSHAAPLWATPHSSEPRRTPSSLAAPQCYNVIYFTMLAFIFQTLSGTKTDGAPRLTHDQWLSLLLLKSNCAQYCIPCTNISKWLCIM